MSRLKLIGLVVACSTASCGGEGGSAGDDAGDPTVVTDVDDYIGTDADETITGTEANDALVGGDGDDQINGLAGDDMLFGGLGDQFTMATGKETGNDVLDGGEGNDQVVGEQGDDVLLGGPGDDLLSGSEGDDTVTGGPDSDSFIYLLVIDEAGTWTSDETSGGNDTITDFEPGTDALIFLNRFNEAFTGPTRAEFEAAFNNAEAGFEVTVAGGALTMTFTGGDSLTLDGSFETAPTTLEELETALGGPNAIVYGE